MLVGHACRQPQALERCLGLPVMYLHMFKTFWIGARMLMARAGRAKAVAVTTTLASWLVHVPASFLLVKYWRDDMQGTMLACVQS